MSVRKQKATHEIGSNSTQQRLQNAKISGDQNI
jgi:hypothetical protein